MNGQRRSSRLSRNGFLRAYKLGQMRALGEPGLLFSRYESSHRCLYNALNVVMVDRWVVGCSVGESSAQSPNYVGWRPRVAV